MRLSTVEDLFQCLDETFAADELPACFPPDP